MDQFFVEELRAQHVDVPPWRAARNARYENQVVDGSKRQIDVV